MSTENENEAGSNGDLKVQETGSVGGWGNGGMIAGQHQGPT